MRIDRVAVRLLVLIVGLWCVFPFRVRAQDGRIVKHFRETDEVLNNPGKGFTTFQRFNGDSLNAPGEGWTEGFPIEYQAFDGTLENERYPQTSIAYFRVYWRYVEPEEGQYNWAMIDSALDTAHARNQTLMLRIAPYGSGDSERRDVPDWYRGMVGPRRDWAYDNPTNKWLVNPEDPRYVEYFGRMIRALGERYDGHPDMEAVDGSFIGAWGEGAGSDLLTEETRRGLVDAYVESFDETPIIMLLMDEKTNTYASSKADVGWRVDCLGDLGFWAEEPGDWTHMYDYYPRAIIEYGQEDAWKKAPVSLEICGTFTRWKEGEGYDLDDVRYIFDQALKWRISSFNAKSSPVPEEWRPAVNEWIKQMGYRFVLRRFTYPETVVPGGGLRFTSWWENKGVAPIYEKYPLVLRLRRGDRTVVLRTDADIREWMPGDNVHDETVFVPRSLPEGRYQLELALVEPFRHVDGTPNPAVELANQGRTADGWYRIGEIGVRGN